MKKDFYKNGVFFFLFCAFLPDVSAQVNHWTGGVNADYFNKHNWQDTTINFTSLTGATLQIGSGSLFNCTLTGGNSSNVNYRPGRLNTLTGGIFTVNGAVYPNNNDSLNGTIIINAPADMNIRNIAYIGNRGNATVNINGGSLSTRNGMFIATGTGGTAAVMVAGGSLNAGSGGANMDLNLATTTGYTGRLNITGGSVKIARNLLIGAGGSIFISGIGMLTVAGDKTTQLNGLVADGRLTCTPGKTLSIVYDGVNTTASLPVNTNSMIREYPDSVVLRTGSIVCVLEKSTGNVLSYRYKGAETVANKPANAHKYMYHDFTTSYGFETVWGCTFEIVQDSTGFAHVVFKRPYTPGIGHVTPVDAELHYALKKDDNGVYVYSRLEHKPNYPRFDIGSWRQVWWIASNNGINLTERIYTDSLRSWQMPSNNDTYTATPIAEIIKMTSGVRAGKYDGKYEYSLRFWDNPVWGHASNVNNIGIWCLNASCEYFNEGPMHQDLNAAAGIIHQCMNGVHYGDQGMVADTLTSWTKVYGPYMLLITDKFTGDSNWIAAKQRQVQEQSLWPYNWVKDTAAYPTVQQRGAVSGRFIINDPQKPDVNGAGAWIGVTDLSDGASNFQFECKHYQYWVKVNEDGTFNIPYVRPGTYSLFAFGDGAVGEYRLDNVTVTAGTTTSLGMLTRNIDRSNGSLLWEIGIPNRMSNEFKLGKFDYCEGFAEQKFRDSFPNPIVYNVADKDWAGKLSYAHTKYPTETFAPGDIWKWRINFTIPAGTSLTGNARLTIAYASNDHAQQWIYVNNDNSTFNTYFPDNGDGNAFIRQANYAKYSFKQILIPMARLQTGNNTITMVMPSNSAWVSHLMYDYISLEANVAGGTLPVTMLSFTAQTTSMRQVQLKWLTAGEVNNTHFEVERSKDGVRFENIGTVQKNNVSSAGGAYYFTDKHPYNGTGYYRLKQVDRDGKYAYSMVKEVIFYNKNINVFPNPAKDFITVTPAGGINLTSVQLYDAAGRILYRSSKKIIYPVNIDLSVYSPGLYMLKADDGNETTVIKIKKQ